MFNVKKLSLISALSGFILTGCATPMPVGALMTNVTLPIGITSNNAGNKTGVAKCESFVGLIARGDCSIEAAMKDGNISKVSHMDWEADNLLGLIGKYKLTVYGQ